MSDGGHAVHPGQNSGCCVQNAGHHAGLRAGEPQRVVGGKVSNAGCVAQQKGLVFQHVGQTPQVAVVGCGGIWWRHSGCPQTHLRAVLVQCLGRWPPLLRRATAEYLCNALGAQAEGHGGPEQFFISPLRENACQSFMHGRIQGGRRLQMFQHIADQGGVAVDVRANLQKGGLAIPASERDHIGFGHDVGHDDGFPFQLLVAQNQADFLGKRGHGKVMKKDVGHGSSPVEQERLNQLAESTRGMRHCT